MIHQVDATKLSIAAIHVAAEVKTLVDRIDEQKVKEILPLSFSEQSSFIESCYPIHELQAQDQIELIANNLDGRTGVPIGAGVAAYTTTYSAEPNENQRIAPETVLLKSG